MFLSNAIDTLDRFLCDITELRVPPGISEEAISLANWKIALWLVTDRSGMLIRLNTDSDD